MILASNPDWTETIANWRRGWPGHRHQV